MTDFPSVLFLIEELMMHTKTSTKTVDFSTPNGPNGQIKLGGKIVFTRSRTGDELPFHKSIIRNKGNATTSLEAWENGYRDYLNDAPTTYVMPARGHQVIKCFSNGINNEIIALPKGQVPSYLVDDAVARATTNAYEKIREYQSPLNGQIFLGELKETLHLLRHPFQTSERLLVALAKNKQKSSKYTGKALAKAVADSWLEFRFGILPLISDVRDILALADGTLARRSTDSFRAYGKAESSTSASQLVGGDGYYLQFQRNVEDVFRAENIIRCGVTIQHLEPEGAFSARLLDSIDDISSLSITAWELIPFSFLVDYFVNVGNIIESAVTSTSMVSYTSSTIVRTWERKISTVEANFGSPGPTDLIYKPASVTLFNRQVSRTNGLMAIPPLVFSLPGSKVRYANIAALLTSLIK